MGDTESGPKPKLGSPATTQIMPVYIALLRGVNVGSAKRVPMAELRALLTDLGHQDVVTLLNSGNAVFRASRGQPAAIAAGISKVITSRLGLEVPVIVKSAKDLTTIVSDNTLAAQAPDHSRLLVAFVQKPDTLTALTTIEPLIVPPEQFLIGSSAAYLHCPAGVLASKAGAALLGKAGGAATTRNWATVLKLQALAKQLTD